ncbi:hypothetical protein DKX38_008898 [Salix brachista]|uniref:Uncharacterized protein n=1 Tax=Salix brachista TaxID=2182728 RepID=A0A5N5M9E9_9ROSI|nr:hypothetical protein DKX38_008898 [Salix brachista]
MWLRILQWHILPHQHQLILARIQPRHQLGIQPWMNNPTSKIVFLWRLNPGVMAFGRDGKPTCLDLSLVGLVNIIPVRPCVAVVSLTLVSEEGFVRSPFLEYSLLELCVVIE